MGKYSIWVAEFASIEQFPEALMIAGTMGPATRRLPYTYFVIRGEGRTIMVDVGFDFRDYAKNLVETMNLNNWQHPEKILEQINIKPEDVTDIIITHAHFDHMGGLEFFPNATFHIQERELTQWVWALSIDKKMQKLHFCINPEDMMRITSLAINGRVKCVRGDADNYFPSIDLRLAQDTHTWGSMYVVVRNDGKTNSDDNYILAGDLVYCYDNMAITPESGGVYSTIVQAVGGQYNLLEATQALIDAAGGNALRVIPAHENRLGEHYKTKTGKYNLKITEITLGDNAAGI